MKSPVIRTRPLNDTQTLEPKVSVSAQVLELGNLFEVGALAARIGALITAFRKQVPECVIAVAAFDVTARTIRGIECSDQVEEVVAAQLAVQLSAADFIKSLDQAQDGMAVAPPSAMLPDNSLSRWVAHRISPDLVCLVGVWREKSFGDFQAIDSNEIAEFAKGVAVTLMLRVCYDRENIENLCAFFDRCNMAFLVVDGALRLLRSNQLAERLIRNGDYLAAGSDELQTGNASLDLRLRRNVSEMLSLGGLREAAIVPLQSKKDGALIKATVIPLRTASDHLAGAPIAAIAVPYAEQSGISSSDLLGLGFTKAEADLVAALLEGKTIKEYAQLKGRAIPTVRAHLKRVMMRLRVHRQADLVRILLGMTR